MLRARDISLDGLLEDWLQYYLLTLGELPELHFAATAEITEDAVAIEGCETEASVHYVVGTLDRFDNAHHTDVSLRSSINHEAIELRRLHRFFGETKAVNDISFTVSCGQVYGYIGPNGAGKTTSMHILSTLDLRYIDAFIDGFSVINDYPEFGRQRLGFMPDSFGTYRDVSCVEYLDFFAHAFMGW